MYVGGLCRLENTNFELTHNNSIMANSVENLYDASLGIVVINTANSNLDGTGAVSSVVTGSTNGTIVKSLIIKAQTDTSLGMVRLYRKISTGNRLVKEVDVPATIKSGRDKSFCRVVPMNLFLESGEELLASTENSDTFNIIAECLNVTYSATTNYLGTSLEYIANGGLGVVDTTNSSLNGSGTIGNSA
jgi:hypothetical protein